MSDVPSDPLDGAGAPPPPGPPLVGPEPAPSSSNRNRLLIVAGLVVLVVVLIAGIVVVTGGDDGSADDEAAQEVFLEPVDHVEDPFTPSVGDGVDEVATTTSSPSTTDAPTTSVVAAAVQSQRGGTPGLYGGTQDQKACDKEKLVEFLLENRDKGEAWAETLGIEYSEIPEFVDGLTPVLLRSDTRVTNHGFRDGRATSIQVVLQAGTAVLVDDHGRPVTKCACGNPLTDPVPTATKYTGDRWDGFDQDQITVVVNNTVVINTFVLIDNDDGEYFERPAGTSGDEDLDFDGEDLGPDDFDPNLCEGPMADPDLCVDLDATTTTTAPQAALDQLLTGSYSVQGTASGPPDACSSGEISLEIAVTGDDGGWTVNLTGPGGTVSAPLDEDQLSFEGSATAETVTDQISGQFFVDGDSVTIEATDVVSNAETTCTVTLSGAKG